MHTTTPTRTAAIRTLSLLTWLLCASVQAQTVHKCQVDGRAVFQAAACPADARMTTVAPQPAAAEISVTARKKSLADLLRERDGADRSRVPEREFQGDGANVLRSRMGAV